MQKRMGRKSNQSPSPYGLVLIGVMIALPAVCSAPVKPGVKSPPEVISDDVSAGKPGPGANAVTHEIPASPGEVTAWFRKVTMPVKERKDVEPNLVTAEIKMEIIKVRKDGTGKFKTIMEAVNSVEAKGNDNRVIIDVGPGIYKEQVKIDRYRPYITLYGCPKEMPTITFDADAPKYQMTDTPTLDVEGDYFNAVNIIIGNTSPAGKYGIAVSVSGSFAAFYNVLMHSLRNTLLDNKGEHMFKDCIIEGSSDIIFGDGRSIYLNTTINVLPNEPASIITAQARKNTDPEGGGFIFVHCKVTGTAGKALLGRTFAAGSRVLWAYSDLGSIVEPKGWFDAFDQDYEKTAFFGEYKNTGPGSNLAQRINLPCTKKVTDADVKPFLNLDFIDGAEWLLGPPQLWVDAGTAKH